MSAPNELHGLARAIAAQEAKNAAKAAAKNSGGKSSPSGLEANARGPGAGGVAPGPRVVGASRVPDGWPFGSVKCSAAPDVNRIRRLMRGGAQDLADALELMKRLPEDHPENFALANEWIDASQRHAA
jgi:hypothetical protein